MFNIFDELLIGMAVKERQARFEREAMMYRLFSEVAYRESSRKERESFAEFLDLALKAFGTNGQMHWKL